jgi:thiamine biosynthesis lipoprotein
MGSPLRMTLVMPGAHVRSIHPDAAWRAVSDEFDAVDAALSRFRDDSEVTALNRLPPGRTVRVGPRLYRGLAAAHRAWRLTNGVFDPRILVDLERLGHGGAPLEWGSQTSSAPSDPWLRRNPCAETVGIAAPIDLGGIGKGLAVRWAMRRLWSAMAPEARPHAGALVDAGGDLAVAGPSPDGGSWSIAIDDPGGEPGPVVVVTLDRGAICTSSTRLERWTDATGTDVHHLIDPATGEPGGEGLIAVTVATFDPAWAEVWSKALFLAGRREIASIARSRGLAAWWIDEDGDLSMTPAARQITIWSRT